MDEIKFLDSLRPSTRKNKRMMILSPDATHWIHFGARNGATFIDHGDEDIRRAWRQRHSKILDRSGNPAYLNPYSPAFYSWRVLW